VVSPGMFCCRISEIAALREGRFSAVFSSLMRWVVLIGLVACSYAPDRSALPDEVPLTTTLFVTDFGSNQLHRYLLHPRDATPDPIVSVPATAPVSVILVPGTEELLVSNLFDANLTRFAAPFATPTPNGTITGGGIAPQVQKMLFIGDELFLVNPGAANVDRVTLDTQSMPVMIDAVTVAVGRGIAFDAARRRLYVTQCCGTDRLLVFDVASDNSLALVVALTGFSNPHGILVTPWDEVLVANAGSNSIARFRINSEGIPTMIGSITGNDLSAPVDLVLTPWNELYVANNVGGKISRFTFDASNDAVARDSFAVPNGINLVYFALDVR
jgi:hypothetical protein